jgi:uncharacterized membrane protein
MKLTIREITIAGVLSAVAILLAVTQLGYIPFFAGVSITIMHVPVIIGAVVAGPFVGTFVGLVFGLTSLIAAIVAPTTPGDVLFTDPFVSVLPRLFIGVAAWAAYTFAQKAGKWILTVIGSIVLLLVVAGVTYLIATSEYSYSIALAVVVCIICLALSAFVLVRALRADKAELALSLSAVAGTLTNSALVLLVLTIRGVIPASVGFTVALTNGPAEMAAAIIITVAVMSAWKQVAVTSKGSSV